MTTATLDRQSARSTHAESRPVRLANPAHASTITPAVGGEYPVKLARADERFQLGHDCGVAWADNVATRVQLERLARLADELGGDEDVAGYFTNIDRQPARACDEFANIVDPALVDDPAGRRRLWRGIARDVQAARVWTDANFVSGVFAASVDAWRTVAAEL
ncbi:hypothetical protein [Singulisphaera sp. PoT]|uniref:hypothetical protein n=1 Tax=Singulisphaera sp. PoT TaxID=3411797 RepID=UPI003BF61C39